MLFSVTMPDLGDSVTEATIGRWLKVEGDTVLENEPLLEVSTDKVDTEIPSPTSGILGKIIAQTDEVLAVGAELAVIDDSPEPTEEVQPQAAPAAAPPNQPSPSPPTEVTPPVRTETTVENPQTSPYVTPLVRRLALELNVDLTQVRGSGIGNRIRKSDLLAFAEQNRRAATAVTPSQDFTTVTTSYVSPIVRLKAEEYALDLDRVSGSGRNGRIRLADLPRGDQPVVIPSTRQSRTEKLTRLRSVIASRMVESLQMSAQLTSVVEVDVTEIGRLRSLHGAEFAGRTGINLSYTPFFIRAALDALADHPALNASVDTASKTVTYHGQIDLCVAVDTDRGLLAPVIRNAGALNLLGIATATAELARGARESTLSADNLNGGTFTITNTGSRGALFDTPIINQPQVAILGTGAVVERPAVVADADGIKSIEIRSMVHLALTYDHRLIDGADAARFLTDVKDRLESASMAVELPAI